MSAKAGIIPVFIPHLGCPNDCVFCNQRRISGSMKPACVQDVINAIDEGLTYSEKPQLAFYGGSFTAIPVEEQRAFLEAAKPYLQTGKISSIRLSTRPDCISPDILNMLREYGVETIELGVQSMCDDVLISSGRGHTAQDAEKASALVKEFGFKLILQMMTGLPGSDFDRDMLTAKRIAALCPDGVRIYPTVIIKDTCLYDMWKSGNYREHTVEDAVELCSEILPVFENAGIPVIRVGLNPTDDLTAGDAAGGAYHPALGEMVKSRIMRKKAEKLLASFVGDCAELTVNKSCVSQMTGQNRCNITYLEEKFHLKSLKVKSGEVEPGEVIVNSGS